MHLVFRICVCFIARLASDFSQLLSYGLPLAESRSRKLQRTDTTPWSGRGTDTTLGSRERARNSPLSQIIRAFTFVPFFNQDVIFMSVVSVSFEAGFDLTRGEPGLGHLSPIYTAKSNPG